MQIPEQYLKKFQKKLKNKTGAKLKHPALPVKNWNCLSTKKYFSEIDKGTVTK